MLSFDELVISGATDLHDSFCQRTPAIRLYDGSDRNHANIASICATHHASDGVFRSTGNQLLVVMTTACSSGSGSISFRAKFHAVNIAAELVAGNETSL